MTESNLSNNTSAEVYKEFHHVNRKLTYATVGLVCLAALLVWLLGIDVKGKHLSSMGLMFMFLALFTYKIPYISFRYLQKKYANESEKRSAIGYDWKTFRDLAMQRR